MLKKRLLFIILITLLNFSLISFNALSVPIQLLSYNPDKEEIHPIANQTVIFTVLNETRKQEIVLKTDEYGYITLPSDKVSVIGIKINGLYLLSSTYGLGYWRINSRYDINRNITSFYFRTPLLISENFTIQFIEGRLLRINRINPFTGSEDIWIRPIFPAYTATDDTLVVAKESTIMLYFDKKISLNPLLEKWGFIKSDSRRYFIYHTISYENGTVDAAVLFTEYFLSNIDEKLLKEINYLENIGFTLPHINKSIYFIRTIFKSAYLSFKNNDTDTGVFLFNRGMNKLLETLEFIESLRSDSFAIVVVLILITFFLSTILSQISKKRFTSQILSFIILFVIEIFTFPQFKLIYHIILLSSGPSYSGESVSQSAIIETLLKLFIGFIFLGLLFFGFRNSKVSDFFNYSVKNLGRRKARSIIVLLTIAIVSSSAVMFVSINIASTKETNLYESSFQGYGLVLRRHITRIIASKTSQNVVFLNYYEPLIYSESKWLLNQIPHIKLSNFYTIFKTMYNKIPIYVVISNFDYLKEIGFNKYFIGNYSLRGVLVNYKLSKVLGINKDDILTVQNYNMLVSGIFRDEALKIENIDGQKYFEKIQYDSYVIIINTSVIENMNLPIIRIDIILDQPIDYANLENFLFFIGYDKEYKDTYLMNEAAIEYTYKSYEITRIEEKKAISEYLGREAVGFESTSEFIIPLVIASLVVAITQLGSVYDRKREIVTISTLGASPLDIIFMLIVEGFAYGIIGGLLGYILGEIITVYLKPPVTVSVSPQSLSPMLTVIFVALAPAVIGCLIPARKIVLEAVPSKLLLKEKGIHLKIEENKAILLMPIRLYGEESLFSEYLSHLEAKPTPIVEGLIFRNHRILKDDGKYIVNAEIHYKGSRYAEYIVLFKIPSNRNKNIECIITPKGGVWKPEHKTELNSLALAIREKLINYVDWKKKKLKFSH